MKQLGEILGTSARLDILRVLHYMPNAVGLRQLARLAGVHPHSAERMLKDLVKEKVVIRKKKAKSRVFFSRNSEHPDWQVLQAVFDAADRASRKLKQPALNQRAGKILPFMEEAGRMLKQAKRSRGVA